MDFFRVKRFKFGRKPKVDEQSDAENKGIQATEVWSDGTTEFGTKEASHDGALEDVDEDDDDFITNEVKRRLKELRKNSFMVLIPEESCLDDEDMSSSEWREAEVGDMHGWCDFNTFYTAYCERMLFFDKMFAQHLKDADSWNTTSQSPKHGAKRLAMAFKSLSFKRKYDILGECELLRSPLKNERLHNLEAAYVSQLCLSWEALHCQYIRLRQQVAVQIVNSSSYIYSAQEFQQFQVLLLRFIENEPFEHGSRVDYYARARTSLPKLLQVPILQASDYKENDDEDLDRHCQPVLAPQLLNLMEDSILTFHCFLKRDKIMSSSSLSLFKGHNYDANSIHKFQISLAKKQAKMKDLLKKKAWKNSWPSNPINVELLFSNIDISIVKRVLIMARISKEQLLWCEEKMSKLDPSERLHRNVSPMLFPY